MKRETFEKLLFKEVKIKPLENLQAVIVAVAMGFNGLTYQLRYYIDGTQHEDWFYEWEVEV
jgi:hypothetical protein